MGRPGGRFWSLRSPDSDSDEEDAGRTPEKTGVSPDGYLRTTTSDPTRDLVEGCSRVQKRLDRRRQQRTAAMELMSPVSSLPSRSVSVGQFADRWCGRGDRQLKLPVTERTTFRLHDELDGATWTMVERRRSSSSSSSTVIRGERGSEFSNFLMHGTSADSQTGLRWFRSLLGHTGRNEAKAGFGLRGIFGAYWMQNTKFAPRVSKKSLRTGGVQPPVGATMANRGGGRSGKLDAGAGPSGTAGQNGSGSNYREVGFDYGSNAGRGHTRGAHGGFNGGGRGYQ